jgi:hypothetical protein
MASDAALLIRGHVDPGPRRSLMRTLGQIESALRAADAHWDVRRYGAVAGEPDELDEHDATNVPDAPDRPAGELRELVAVQLRANILVVVAVGCVIDVGSEPALVLATGQEAATLPLRAIAGWIRSSGAASAVIVLAGLRDTGSERALAAAWFDALATDRSCDVVAVGAAGSAGALVEALLDGLSGRASDPTTGTVTLRSLGEYLARSVPGAAIQRTTEPARLLEPPPLTGAWDPRLTRRSQITTEPEPGVVRSTEPDDLTGMVLPGRFRVDAMLARGGFGAVYRARQLSVERDVAVKVLHTTIDPASHSGRMFVQEIASVGRIDHPNVVRIYQADITPGGRLFYAMELLGGRDLEQLSQEAGPIERPRAVALTIQLLAGLGAAHEVGLVHADIKPANALLVASRDGERVVLVDFGLARLRTLGQPAQSLGGTPAYMAPEQLRENRVDARSDLFSAAVVLVTLLTGWRRRSMHELGPPLDDIAEAGLRQVLQRALAIDPADRFQTAAELGAALAVHAAPETFTLAPRDPRPEIATTADTRSTRTRWMVAASVAFGLAVAVAGAVRWQARHAANRTVLATRPTVIVGGSGTVLFGFLDPLHVLLEQRSFTSIPVRSMYDVGSGGAIRSISDGEFDLAALSARFDRGVPENLVAAGKLLVEVAIGYDETALFVRRDNPLRRIDIVHVRAHLCCEAGEALRAMTWSELGLEAPGLATRFVAWGLFGREHPPGPRDSTSATLLLADRWWCAPRQLCASGLAGSADVEANEVLSRLATERDVLLLSSRGFATDQVVPLVTVDSTNHTRLDGRKVLWLYLPVTRGAAIPAKVCRFLDAVLDARFAAELVVVGKAQPLPAVLRQRQRRALGLDDTSCTWRPVGELSSPALDGGILRSPIGAEVEISDRWVADPGA